MLCHPLLLLFDVIILSNSNVVSFVRRSLGQGLGYSNRGSPSLNKDYAGHVMWGGCTERSRYSRRKPRDVSFFVYLAIYFIFVSTGETINSPKAVSISIQLSFRDLLGTLLHVGYGLRQWSSGARKVDPVPHKNAVFTVVPSSSCQLKSLSALFGAAAAG